MKTLTHQEILPVSGGSPALAVLAGGMFAGYTHNDEIYETVSTIGGGVTALIGGYSAYCSPIMAINPVGGAIGAIVGMGLCFPLCRFITFLGYKAGEIAAA